MDRTGVNEPRAAERSPSLFARWRFRLAQEQPPRPLRVEIVGLFPLYYKMCPRGMPWGYACGLEGPAEQEREYPEAERRGQRRLEALVRHLAARFGSQVDPVTVPLTSLRGTWLATRHRIRTGELAVVVGGRCARFEEDYEAVDRLIEGCLAGGEPRRPGGDGLAGRPPQS
ncbi:hypothetical protein Tmar_2253 [Thermaerobacter marianensis DSM 12885]|uniref:Uncharacterized protein n=1 Tax=Thermaerobacter marianensis (strain ATCC 700841 / DSM 12885 / JCM 10246 / 7p75a) TaxID=644966 RepID=E6SKV8_THEM7|nr:hypothetical protein [Thermaerobacter marianensis]ADU52331.1 hypothetical protein Tmar_2253 [Thermaerobacter marianensis DSM 12885]